VGWDAAIAAVANVGNPNPFGHSTQAPVIAGLTGSATTLCANTGNTCSVVNQTNTTFNPVNVPQGTVVIGTLVMDANNLGAVALSVTNSRNGTDTSGAAVTTGSNFNTAEVVPEPGTAALMALGLLGLGLGGRLRRA
jgi:hypothetical protein